MRLSEMQNKDIINVKDGKKIGNIIDININPDGTSSGIVVEKNKFLISHFSSNGEIIIKWKDIEKIGTDVILVNINN